MPNSILPLVILPAAVPPAEATPGNLATRFRENGWQGTWTYTIFDYWHYHETGHEVLACCRGQARIGFGGEDRLEVAMGPGDAVIVPAGVGHRLLVGFADFAVVGAYPPGQNGTVTRAGSADIEVSRHRIAQLKPPETDPLDGDRPGVLAVWCEGSKTGGRRT